MIRVNNILYTWYIPLERQLKTHPQHQRLRQCSFIFPVTSPLTLKPLLPLHTTRWYAGNWKEPIPNARRAEGDTETPPRKRNHFRVLLYQVLCTRRVRGCTKLQSRMYISEPTAGDRCEYSSKYRSWKLGHVHPVKSKKYVNQRSNRGKPFATQVRRIHPRCHTISVCTVHCCVFRSTAHMILQAVVIRFSVFARAQPVLLTFMYY